MDDWVWLVRPTSMAPLSPFSSMGLCALGCPALKVFTCLASCVGRALHLDRHRLDRVGFRKLFTVPAWATALLTTNSLPTPRLCLDEMGTRGTPRF